MVTNSRAKVALSDLPAVLKVRCDRLRADMVAQLK
jgi:hypothetical protein